MTLSEEAQARSNMYGLLSRLVRAEVDAALLAELRSPAVADSFREVGLKIGQILPEGNDAQLLDDLAREYCRLFLLTLSPHESVQRGEGQLWGEHTAKVQSFLEDLCLVRADDRGLLPDHLATELEIMQHLTDAEASLIEAGGIDVAAVARDRQRHFLKTHLLAWAPMFLGVIQAQTVSPFYAGVATLGRLFLLSEAEVA